MSLNFVSSEKLYEYKDGRSYDENYPDYKFFKPVYSGRFYIVDCIVVDDKGKSHPEYTGCGVPIHTDDLQISVPPCPRERIIELAETLSWEVIARELIAQMSKKHAEVFVEWVETTMI